MAIIEISGCREGFKKVTHTQLLRTYADLSLSEAKAMTDQVLAGEMVRINVPDVAGAQEMLKALLEIGASARIAQK